MPRRTPAGSGNRGRLGELATALAAKHAAHCAGGTELAQRMTEAATAFTDADGGASDAVARVADAMGV